MSMTRDERNTLVAHMASRIEAVEGGSIACNLADSATRARLLLLYIEAGLPPIEGAVSKNRAKLEECQRRLEGMDAR